MKIHAKCTSCRKTAVLTTEQIQEAREVGCAFSACCNAIAVVTKVEGSPS